MSRLPAPALRPAAISPQSVAPPATATSPIDGVRAAETQPLGAATVAVDAGIPTGATRALDELRAYLRRVGSTGAGSTIGRAGAPVRIEIAMDVSLPVNGFRIEVRDGVVRIFGRDLLGVQYGIYRFMELTGARFYSYRATHEPAPGSARMPANGFRETVAPPANWTTRGFSPHLYHPVPLSIALNDLSKPEHVEHVRQYFDWLVRTRQNHVLLPLLELDRTNRFVPIIDDERPRMEAWLDQVRPLVDYAHERGLTVGAKVAFANFVSSNPYAINPVNAVWQSLRIATASGARRERLVDQFAREDATKIRSLVDRLMQVPWDEVAWNLGTSEFTPTSDELTLRWMNDAAAHVSSRYPATRTSVRSHIPDGPTSKTFGTTYYDLYRVADAKVGALIHTTHAYALTDPAPVYGVEDFGHKLDEVLATRPDRHEVFYPETSYWVSHDVSVPLFLPVYVLNRARDAQLVAKAPNLDGHIGFTTGWEWGYWLNDYALARFQADPSLDATQVLAGALEPFGATATPMTQLLRDVMLDQQRSLLDGNLIRYLQGWDALTEFGARAKDIPVVGSLLHGANNQPVRIRPADVLEMDDAQLAEFERTQLRPLLELAERFEAYAARSRALESGTTATARGFHDELSDGLQVNALRARQMAELLAATVALRRAKRLGRGPVADAARGVARLHVERARQAVAAARVAVADRERDYRDPASMTIATDQSSTMWAGRYLTPVHDLRYWTNSQDEVERLLKR